MSFVYNIIPDLQLGEIMDLLSLILPSFFLFLLLRTKNVTLRQHDIFQKRIFKSF